MAIKYLVVEPEITPSFRSRIITSRIMQTVKPRIAVINAEYTSTALDVLKSENTVDISFFDKNEILLTKANLSKPKLFSSLTNMYMQISQDNAEQVEELTLKMVLQLLNVISKNDNELYKNLNFWVFKSNEEIAADLSQIDLSKKVNTVKLRKQLENLIDSLSNPNYTVYFNSVIKLLYELHHFAVLGKAKAFNIFKSKKLIVLSTESITRLNIARASTLFMLMAGNNQVFLDSSTPDDMLAMTSEPSFTVDTVTLKKSTTDKITSILVNQKANIYFSVQGLNSELLLEYIAKENNDFLEINHISKKSLSEYFDNKEYDQLLGKYLSFSAKDAKLYIISLPQDIKKKLISTVMDTQKITSKHKVKDTLKASKSEVANLPNTADNNFDIKKTLKGIQSSLDKILELQNASNPDILSKIKEVQKNIKVIKMEKNNGIKDNKQINPKLPPIYDIFGNMENGSSEDINNALKEEFEKQDSSTKDKDILHKLASEKPDYVQEHSKTHIDDQNNDDEVLASEKVSDASYEGNHNEKPIEMPNIEDFE